MMKKLISGILILVMAISSCAFVAFGEDAGTSGNATVSADIEFARAVGIFTEDVTPEDPVSRMDLARCILDIVLQGTELATEDGSLLFDDVDYDSSGYADAIAKAGIMGGTGNRQFQPNGNVTYAQALKVFVSFLGYDVKARSLGGYPSGYMAVATQLGITDKYAPYGDSYITWETLASLFKRSLGVPLFQIVTYKDSTFIYNPNPQKDYLREYFGISRYSDVINGVYGANILGYADVEYDEIILGTTVFRFDPDVMNLSEKFGHRIEAYYADMGDHSKILYFDEYDNNIISLDGREVEGFSDGILYYNGKKEKKININMDTNIIYNGKLLATYDEDIFNVWNLSTKDGSLKAIDNNSDRTFDFVIIDAYESYVVGSILGDTIVPKYRKSVYVDISSYNEGENVLFYNLKGKPVSIEKVVKGSVISVSHDIDGNVSKIVVTTDSYTGEIEEIEVEDGRYYITVAGTRYTPSEVLSLNPQVSALRAGQKITMMFNKDGLLSDVDGAQFNILETAYLYAAKKGTSLEAQNSVTIRVFSSGGFFKNYDFAKHVEVLYGSETSVKKPLEVLSLLGKTGEGDVTRQVIVFKKNDEGQINWINIANDEERNVDGLYRYDLASMGMNAATRYLGIGFVGKLLISGTSAFSVPSEANRYNEDLYFVGSLKNNTDYTMKEAYGDEQNGKVAHSIVIERDSSGTFTNSPGYMLVESVKYSMDADREPSVKVTGYISGTLKEYFGDEIAVKNNVTGAFPEKGDIIKFTLNKENRIEKISTFVFDVSERASGDVEKMMPTAKVNPNVESFNDTERYVYGKIIWSNDESFVPQVEGSDPISTESYLKAGGYRYFTYEDIGSKGGLIQKVKNEAVYAYPEGSIKSNYAVVFVNYGTPTDIIIYK